MTGALEADATVVCVLGMSRTGTSLTTRMLHILGVYLGPEEELLGKELTQLAGEGEHVLENARAANPEGFWEHYRIMRLNERILHSLGGNWRRPPALPAGWEAGEQLEAERAEALSVLEQSFAGQRLWGWKDPRNCLTLPFWQRLLPQMRYVICLRNPLDVAASLGRRDRMAFDEAIGLWTRYVAAGLVNTSGRRRLLVSYERFFDDPEGTASRLARFVGREGALGEPEIAPRLAAAIDARLWRNRADTRQALADARVTPATSALRHVTELLAVAEQVEDATGVDRLEAAADALARHLLDDA